jgi:hypothetical protein
MAIDYDSLFTCWGKLVKHTNLVEAWIEQIGIHQEQVEDDFDAAGVEVEVDDLPDQMQGMQDNVTNWIIGDMKGLFDNFLLDPVLLVNELVFSTTPTPRTVLEKLFYQMVLDTTTIYGTGPTISAGTVTSGNTNALDWMYGDRLDGVSPPAADIVGFRGWAGKESLLLRQIDLSITCTADSESGGAARGGEGFLVEGGEDHGSYSRLTEGAGRLSVNAANSRSISPAGKFDSWSDSTQPAGWTLVNIPADNHQQSVNGVRGTNCLQLISGGSAHMRLPIAASQLTRRGNYFLWFLLKRVADPSAGELVVSLADDGGTLSGASITVGHAAIDETDWKLYYVNFTVPNSITGTPYINLEVTTPFNAALLVDDVSVTPAYYFNGFPLGVVALDGKLIVGDLIQSDGVGTPDLTPGVLATFLRKQYRFQLPMDDNSPTYDDTLFV